MAKRKQLKTAMKVPDNYEPIGEASFRDSMTNDQTAECALFGSTEGTGERLQEKVPQEVAKMFMSDAVFLQIRQRLEKLPGWFINGSGWKSGPSGPCYRALNEKALALVAMLREH